MPSYITLFFPRAQEKGDHNMGAAHFGKTHKRPRCARGGPLISSVDTSNGRAVSSQPRPRHRFARVARASPAPVNWQRSTTHNPCTFGYCYKIALTRILLKALLKAFITLWLALRAPWRDATQLGEARPSRPNLSRARAEIYWFSKPESCSNQSHTFCVRAPDHVCMWPL